MSITEEASVNIADSDGSVTVTGGGSLTFINATAFGEGLKQASLNADSVVVDLRPAKFIDTQIIQDLGRTAITLLERGKRLKVILLETAYPLRVIKISGLQTIMDIEVE